VRLGPRRSLLGRLVIAAMAIAVASIAVTTWLVVTTTTAGIRQQQGRSLEQEAHVYGRLLDYAASHRDWDGAAGLIARVSDASGLKMALTGTNRSPIASSLARTPATPVATVDPLRMPASLAPGVGGGIDPIVLGPYAVHRLARGERTVPAVALPEAAPPAGNEPLVFVRPKRVRQALDALGRSTSRCVSAGQGGGESGGSEEAPSISLRRGSLPTAEGAAGNPMLARCFDAALRHQLRGWVAPPALLFMQSPSARASARIDLSGSHRRTIIEVALAILALTLLVSVFAARRLTRPLAKLTEATERMTAGDRAVSVAVRGDDELARLGRAFNELAARRDQLEDARTAMVADVAHELRTPVSNIRGWLEAVEDGLAEPDPELLVGLLEEATSLQHLIDDLQELSAADAGELRLYPEEVRLLDLLEYLAAAHRAAAERAGVTLTVSGDPDLVTWADPVRLRQAVGNLLANAIRHSPPTRMVAIVVTADADRIRIAVTDEGPGIAPADLPYVFERFWKADRSRGLRDASGSGLGLSIAQRLVEAHGGQIAVASPPGEGATFTIELVVRADRRAGAAPRSAAENTR
jgi:two-component system sensor histidine kinase BaeS